MKTNYFTVSNIDGTFASYSDALAAWVSAGSPRMVGSSVWISEHVGCDTVKTYTIA